MKEKETERNLKLLCVEEAEYLFLTLTVKRFRHSFSCRRCKKFKIIFVPSETDSVFRVLFRARISIRFFFFFIKYFANFSIYLSLPRRQPRDSPAVITACFLTIYSVFHLTLIASKRTIIKAVSMYTETAVRFHFVLLKA